MFTPPPPPSKKKKKKKKRRRRRYDSARLNEGQLSCKVWKILLTRSQRKCQCQSFDKWNSPNVCLVWFLYMNVNVHASHNILCKALRASSFLQFRNEAYNHYVARLMAASEGWTFVIARAHTRTIRASVIKRIILLCCSIGQRGSWNAGTHRGNSHSVQHHFRTEQTLLKCATHQTQIAAMALWNNN